MRESKKRPLRGTLNPFSRMCLLRSIYFCLGCVCARVCVCAHVSVPMVCIHGCERESESESEGETETALKKEKVCVCPHACVRASVHACDLYTEGEREREREQKRKSERERARERKGKRERAREIKSKRECEREKRRAREISTCENPDGSAIFQHLTIGRP